MIKPNYIFYCWFLSKVRLKVQIFRVLFVRPTEIISSRLCLFIHTGALDLHTLLGKSQIVALVEVKHKIFLENESSLDHEFKIQIRNVEKELWTDNLRTAGLKNLPSVNDLCFQLTMSCVNELPFHSKFN